MILMASIVINAPEPVARPRSASATARSTGPHPESARLLPVCHVLAQFARHHLAMSLPRDVSPGHRLSCTENPRSDGEAAATAMDAVLRLPPEQVERATWLCRGDWCRARGVKLAIEHHLPCTTPLLTPATTGCRRRGSRPATLYALCRRSTRAERRGYACLPLGLLTSLRNADRSDTIVPAVMSCSVIRANRISPSSARLRSY